MASFRVDIWAMTCLLSCSVSACLVKSCSQFAQWASLFSSSATLAYSLSFSWCLINIISSISALCLDYSFFRPVSISLSEWSLFSFEPRQVSLLLISWLISPLTGGFPNLMHSIGLIERWRGEVVVLMMAGFTDRCIRRTCRLLEGWI